MLPLTAPVDVSGGLARETTSVPRHNELSVATFNVENLDPGDVATIPRLAALVADNLRAPDLIGIEEMQDNNGETNNGNTDASLSWQAFIDAIVAAGGPRYQYRQIDPQNNADGGAPGGNIRVGFLFRSDRGLRFVDSGAGDATTPTAVVRSRGEARLTLSPGRVDPRNRGLGVDAQAAGRRVHMEGPAVHRDRQPLQLEGRGRPAVRSLAAAGPLVGGRASSAGRVGQRVRRPDPGGGPQGRT